MELEVRLERCKGTCRNGQICWAGWQGWAVSLPSFSCPSPTLRTSGVCAEALWCVWAWNSSQECALNVQLPEAAKNFQRCKPPSLSEQPYWNMATVLLNFLVIPIFAFLCGVGLLLLSLYHLKKDPSFPVFWKQRDINQVNIKFINNKLFQIHAFNIITFSKYCFSCILQPLICIHIFT